MSKFALGQLVVTAAVHARKAAEPAFDVHVASCLFRFTRGDWGEIDPADARANDAALGNAVDGVQGVYRHPAHPELWIITDPGREVTTILFPDDY